ncbi:MAG: hypothetical protein ABII68_11225 [Pseudomonadota bacterium]
MKAPDWSFKDADGNVFSMASWEGKVLLVNYTDPDAADLNEHFTDAMKKPHLPGRYSGPRSGRPGRNTGQPGDRFTERVRAERAVRQSLSLKKGFIKKITAEPRRAQRV